MTATENDVKQHLVLYQITDFIIGMFTGLLALRFLFRLARANPATPVVSFLYSVTNVLLAPFRYIFPTPSIEGAVFEWSTLAAILGYLLLGALIKKLIEISLTSNQ